MSIAETEGAINMSESNKSIMAMLEAMHKEQQAQVGLVMQRISGIEDSSETPPPRMT